MPINPVTEVTSVTANGDDITADALSDYDSKPQRIELDNRIQKDLVINYTAGYPDANSIPPSVIAGILSFASYLYEHRGSCDVGSVAGKSGALGLWQTEMMILNL